MPNQLIFLFLFNMDNLNIYSTIDLQKIITCISFIIAIVNIILENGINQQFFIQLYKCIHVSCTCMQAITPCCIQILIH